MRQTTLPEQTAKLIELGFEKPKNTQYVQRVKARNLHSPFIEFGEPEFEGSYSIGELIEILPRVIEFGEKWAFYLLRVVPTVGGGWAISYCNEYDERNNELIDALYDMVIKLKEEGVI